MPRVFLLTSAAIALAAVAFSALTVLRRSDSKTQEKDPTQFSSAALSTSGSTQAKADTEAGSSLLCISPGRSSMVSRAKAVTDQQQASSTSQAQPAALIASSTSDAMRKLFDGKLVRMENGELRPYPAENLQDVRYYALYYSAHWCAPCRQFTPDLVEFYQRVKAQHPDFEVIFISNDHDAGAMQTYMKTVGMPWPAVRFEQIDSTISNLAGEGIPWLGIFDASGAPLSTNSRTGQWIDPGIILRSFERTLAESTAH